MAPTRRVGSIRRNGPDGPAVQPACPASGRPGQLRQPGQRPGGGHALHRGAACARGQRDAGQHRPRNGRLRGKLRWVASRATRAPRQAPEPAHQRRFRHRCRNGDKHPASQSERNMQCRNPSGRRSGRDVRRPHEVRQRSGLPDRRDDHGTRGHSQRVHDRPGPNHCSV